MKKTIITVFIILASLISNWDIQIDLLTISQSDLYTIICYKKFCWNFCFG